MAFFSRIYNIIKKSTILDVFRKRLTYLTKTQTLTDMFYTYRPKSEYITFIVSTNSRYRPGTVNSNTVNSKFHLIRSYCEIFFCNFPNIPCLKYTVNSNFHLIRSKTLLMNDFELTVPNLYDIYD